MLTVWLSWSSDWLLSDKVSFDGESHLIYVHPDVTELDIRSDLYKSWVDWVMLYDNSKYLPAVRYTGLDPIGGGNYTGDAYFLINNWKLIVDLSKVRVTGVLFSDNYDSAYYTSNLVAQYPATVSSLINSIATPAEVSAEDIRVEIDANSVKLETIAVNTVPTTVSDSVWSNAFVNRLLTVAKFLGLK